MNVRAGLNVWQVFDLPRRTPKADRAGHRRALRCAVAWAAAILVVAIDAHAAEKKLGIGLYGGNGHQLTAAKLATHAHAQLVAIVDVRGTTWPETAKRYKTLDELIADPQVELVALCSPRRADQARDAIRCLEAGKHVYAEKPSALTEVELDQVLAAARRAGKEFHEMAGTAFSGSFAPVRKAVRDGVVGEVVQVFVQKSYRYGRARQQDEAIDGGMFLQVGIHAARLVEHAGSVRITSITGWETAFGSPEKGEGKMAGAVQMDLENGGIATIILNYLNPSHPDQPHGNETLRVFGTKGFVESVDGGARTRLVTADKAVEPLERAGSGAGDYFDFLAAHLVTGAAMPLTLEEELHPLRMLLRAKEKMRGAEKKRAERPAAPAGSR